MPTIAIKHALRDTFHSGNVVCDFGKTCRSKNSVFELDIIPIKFYNAVYILYIWSWENELKQR